MAIGTVAYTGFLGLRQNSSNARWCSTCDGAARWAGSKGWGVGRLAGMAVGVASRTFRSTSGLTCELAPCAVTDVQHLDPLCLLDNVVDDAIDVRLVPVQ